MKLKNTLTAASTLQPKSNKGGSRMIFCGMVEFRCETNPDSRPECLVAIFRRDDPNQPLVAIYSEYPLSVWVSMAAETAVVAIVERLCLEPNDVMFIRHTPANSCCDYPPGGQFSIADISWRNYQPRQDKKPVYKATHHGFTHINRDDIEVMLGIELEYVHPIFSLNFMDIKFTNQLVAFTAYVSNKSSNTNNGR